jgi:hypothetical protein
MFGAYQTTDLPSGQSKPYPSVVELWLPSDAPSLPPKVPSGRRSPAGDRATTVAYNSLAAEHGSVGLVGFFVIQCHDRASPNHLLFALGLDSLTPNLQFSHSSTASRGGAQLTGKNTINHGRCSWGLRTGFAVRLCRCFQTVFGLFPVGRGTNSRRVFIYHAASLVTVNHRSA